MCCVWGVGALCGVFVCVGYLSFSSCFLQFLVCFVFVGSKNSFVEEKNSKKRKRKGD